MIGHLQRNKVKPLLPLVDYIHSIDSLRLAEEIETHAAKLGRKVPVLLEVNASEEKSKFGVAVGAAVHLAEQIDTMDNIQLVGLMTMAGFGTTDDEARPAFALLRETRDRLRGATGLPLPHLSMGMSGDFEAAIEEGAHFIRVGTGLFGARAAPAE